ncbi:ead/Ea22-like family protein [Pseudomonas aeruginosa]|uniref:ead/Ea22-like family protein n=1 Tax=Pseudomonas aeruginosa TaxID=287 RepID=UPI001CD206A3|nr:ead/Ea22-like family protein [Pseudomonas aeruginosa]
MTDHAELRRLAEVATPGEWRTGDGDDSLPDCVLSGEFVVCEHAGGDVDYIAAANPKTVLALLDEIDGLNDELSACTEHPGGCGYWREAAKRRAEERDRLRAQNDALRGALQAVVDDPTWRSNDNTLWPKIIKAMNPAGRH